MSRLVVIALAFGFAACTTAPPPSSPPPPTQSDPAPPPTPVEPAPTPDPTPDPAPDPAPPPVATAKPDGASCLAASECESGTCEGEGCGADQPGTCMPRQRGCTRDLRTYCGCDGKTFKRSGSCPGQRFSARASCPRPLGQ